MGDARYRRAAGPAAFTAIYMLASAVDAVVRGNSEFIFYIFVMLVLIALVTWMYRSVAFSAGLLWCLSGWGLLHMAGGLVPVPESWPTHGEQRVLYSLWLIPDALKYDHLVHAFGFGTTTWLCWQAARSRWPDTRATFGPLTLCALAALGCGALNEVVEFIATLTIPETNVGGYINTGWDLVANTIGAVIAAVMIRLGGCKPQRQ